jgi:hypothetical protein
VLAAPASGGCTVSARCERTELPAAMCACPDHRSAGTRTATVGIVQERPQPGWFVARYPGVCRGCFEPFTAGTHITGTDGSDGWTAECCDEGDRG